jgi:putative nucleotidyltransferase with HDIG domain
MKPCVINYSAVTAQPEIVSRITEIDEESPNCFRHIANLLRSDQATASLILRVANSPIYNRSQPIKTLPIAISLLGINIIRSLVILAFTRSVFSKSKNELICKHVWQHSLLTAIASHSICLELGSFEESEEAFVAGLLHDIGKVLLFTNARKEYMQALNYALEKCCSSAEAEEKFIGINHYQVGSQAIKKWKLPEQFHRYAGTDLDQLQSDQAEDKILISLKVANNLIKGAGIGASPCEFVVRKERLMNLGLNEKFSDYLLEDSFFEKLLTNEIYQFCIHGQD